MSSWLSALTVVHVAISLAAIAAGFVVVWGLMARNALPRWTAAFLALTVATSVTGFFFPITHFTPGHAVGLISLVALAVALFALYGRRLAGAWRPIYVVTAVMALYFNMFVLVVQSFEKVPALKELAPTQSEPPFQIAQLVVLVAFVAIAIAGVIRFRVGPLRAAGTP
jgi:hypothetical protein